MKHRREQRTGADQIAGCNEDVVRMTRAQLFDQRRHVLRAAGRDIDPLRSVRGIDDADAAGRRPQVAVKIVDRENPQLHGRGIRSDGR